MNTIFNGISIARSQCVETARFLFAGVQLASKLVIFMAGAAVIYILTSTGQGEELLRISAESKKTIAEVVVFSLIPMLYALLTYFSAVIFIGLIPYAVWIPVFGLEVKKVHLHIWAVLLSFPVPTLFLLKFDWPLARMLAASLLVTFVSLTFRRIYRHHKKSNYVSTSSENSAWAATNLSTRFVSIVLVIVLAFLIVCCVLTAMHPELARYLGTIGVLTLSISMWAMLITAALGIAPCFFGAPCLYLLLVLSVPLARSSVMSMHLKDARILSSAGGSLSDTRPTVITHFERWLEKFKDYPSDRPIPVFLVVAEGGGIRAASWTSSVLQALDVETGGQFSRHAFAYSGVSGGAVGIGFHLTGPSKDNELINGHCGTPCALTDDFLSPLVARIAILDPLRAIPFFEEKILPRDAFFEKTLEQSFSMRNGENSLADSFKDNFGLSDASHRSIVVFNTTDASTGNRVHFSNALIESGHDGFSELGLEYLKSPSSLFLHLSARFPLVSPPAVLRASSASSNHGDGSQPNSFMVLVDGGYRENTGAEEILAIATKLLLYRKEAFSDYIEPVGISFASPGSYSDDEVAAREHDDMAMEQALDDLRPKFEAKERQRKLRNILSRVQIHVIAITNNDYAIPVDSTVDRILTMPALSIPLEAILSGRLATTRESINDLRYLPEPIDTSSFSRCESLKKEPENLTRLGEKGTIEWNIALDGFNNLYHECQSETTQDSYIEFSLLKTDGGIAPPLGWHLSPITHQMIRQKARRYSKKLGAKNYFLSSAWWETVHELHCNLMVDARLEVDAKGVYQCIDDARQVN